MQIAKVIGIYLIASNATAQDSPYVGLLFNTQERSSLSYRCTYTQNGLLECDFVQAAIRPKSDSTKLAGLLNDARKQFKSEKPPTVEDCKTYRQISSVFEGKTTAPKPEGLAALTPVEKADGMQIARVMLDYCNRPSEETYLAIVRANHERDVRTCTISTNAFSQTFRKAQDQTTKNMTWVVQSVPEGTCGTVQLSRFEAEEISIGTGKFFNWKYIARKAITNPNAEFFPGQKCSSFDEKPYTYDWRQKDHQLTCQYIVFSPL